MAEGVPAVLLGGRAKLADPSQLTELQLFQLKKELELDADRASGLTSAGGERSGAEPFPLPPDSGPRGMVLRERETALKMRISPLSVKCGGPGSGGGGGGGAAVLRREGWPRRRRRGEARAEARGKGFDTASGAAAAPPPMAAGAALLPAPTARPQLRGRHPPPAPPSAACSASGWSLPGSSSRGGTWRRRSEGSIERVRPSRTGAAPPACGSTRSIRRRCRRQCDARRLASKFDHARCPKGAGRRDVCRVDGL